MNLYQYSKNVEDTRKYTLTQTNLIIFIKNYILCKLIYGRISDHDQFTSRLAAELVLRS